MAARLRSLGDHGVAALLLEEARVGHGRRRREDPGARRAHTREEGARGEAEVKAHDLGPDLLDHGAGRLVEGQLRRAGRGGPGIDSELLAIASEELAPPRVTRHVGCIAWLKKFRLTGFLVRSPKTATCRRIASGESMAQGIEPRRAATSRRASPRRRPARPRRRRSRPAIG